MNDVKRPSLIMVKVFLFTGYNRSLKNIQTCVAYVGIYSYLCIIIHHSTFFMCESNIVNGKLDFTGKTKACLCGDGKRYRYVRNCTECKGTGKVKKGTRNYRCKAPGCGGTGTVRLETPVLLGDCTRCNGTALVPADRCDSVNQVDKELVFQWFNFDKPYTQPTSTYNEEYLGIGIICGVTDYGRYLSMTPDQFKQEVKENFMRGFLQYVSLADKFGNLPKEILISKKRSGWCAYPVYMSEREAKVAHVLAA